MNCPYCGRELNEWDRRFYCANMACPARQEDLPPFVWLDLVAGKKAQRQLRTVKDRCVKKIKAKEREIAIYLNGISVRQSENETLAKQIKQAQDALKEIVANPHGAACHNYRRARRVLEEIGKIAS